MTRHDSRGAFTLRTISRLEFEYLIGTERGIERRAETHRLGLFTQEQMEEAFRGAGLGVERLPKVLHQSPVHRAPDSADAPAVSRSERPVDRAGRGFTVEYRAMGREGDRSQFNADRLAILINLDHPVVSAALGNGGVEDPAFRRLSYEVAFAEYAMGIGYRMLLEDPEMPADDLMYEVRTTLNRVSRAASALYG
ncbi:MAG: hypothetical protein O2958_09635 [Gemmatimonadetes bacterium]|nr:hypothetical protein [Gemmatimonadota bacterium]MDA1103325.1 hypothetical protein [Gemmatimonadota bacterium]